MNPAQRDSIPPVWLAAAICLAVAGLFAFLRLYIFATHLVPLTFALPLLLALWHRRRGLHYALAALYLGMAFADVHILPAAGPEALSPLLSFGMMVLNIGIVAIVVDALLVSRRRIIESNRLLEEANAELEAGNEELATREEEISSQNEELQRQTEELEQQTEELQQQTEELQSQSEELQHLHAEAAERTRILQSLLQITTDLSAGASARAWTGRICQSAVSALGDEVSAALLVEQTQRGPSVAGYHGIGAGQGEQEWLQAFDDPLVDLVIREGRAACIEDLANTPDVHAPRASSGQRFRSVLAAPLRIRDEVSAALVLYAGQVRHWSEDDFRMIQWLAAQASLVLEAMRLQEELDRRSREAEEGSRRKTRFLAAVSHDVRTPANAISLSADLLKMAGEKPELMDDLPEMIEMLRANAKLLVELVSDVLDLSRFDSGKIDLEESQFDLEEVVRAEVAQYQPLAQAAGLVLSAESRVPGPVAVRTDRMKLARVLGNLIGNAIKFTEVGSVRVECIQTDAGLVEIRVVDTGVGIPREQLEHIFDEFYQIKNPERDRSKGTGLGLAICKRLVDALGWSLTVASRPGEGSTFTLRLSDVLCDAPPEPQPLPAALQAGGDSLLAGVRVLLVEDHESTRKAVARLLSQHGARVDPAEDGRAALHRLGHSPPDVVLLDLMLPDMDGREILRHLRGKRPKNLKCLLAVSGDVQETRLKELDALGADGLVAKPIQMDQLLERIALHLGKNSVQEAS